MNNDSDLPGLDVAVKAALELGLLVVEGGKVYRCGRGDAFTGVVIPEDKRPIRGDIRVRYDGIDYDTTPNRVRWFVLTGDWPYGQFIREDSGGNLYATSGANSKLTDEQITELVTLRASGVGTRELARRFGVRVFTVRRIFREWATPSEIQKAEDTRFETCPMCAKNSRGGVCFDCRFKQRREAARKTKLCACGRHRTKHPVCSKCRARHKVLTEEAARALCGRLYEDH